MELEQKLKAAVPLLSEGFLAHWEPILKQIEEELDELKNKQNLLMEDLKNTNTLMESQENYEYIASSFSKLPQYHTKLQNIRNTMLTMLARSKNMKQRAAQLKLFKEQQLAQVAKKQQRERTFDQTVLAAKVIENNPIEQKDDVTKTNKKKKKERAKEKGKTKDRTVLRREIEFDSSSTVTEVPSTIFEASSTVMEATSTIIEASSTITESSSIINEESSTVNVDKDKNTGEVDK
ncbi:Snapin/Pallidin-domain-containing protein [Gigaspora rosea]|uniref:Snapin/Pallidin-domain-containing protein n=1 Tax=Gigaspora rosea TaxID=44941 RepID=A0A397UFJ3_9GLOM|nr:Snapin/Pallidin-domain-containing protein [Gigaspora rosea]